MRWLGLLGLALLASCSDGAAPPPATSDRPLEEWVKRLVSSDGSTHREAVAALVDRGADAAPVLLPRLADDWPEVFSSIAEVATRSPALRPFLREALSGEDRKLAGRAALLLADSPPDTPGGKAVTAGLRKALEDGMPWIRLTAAEVLWSRTREAGPLVPVLLALLRSGDARWIDTAAGLVGRIGPPARAAIPVLEEIVAKEPAPTTPGTGSPARLALRHLRDPGIRGVLLDPEGKPLPGMRVIGVVHAEGLLYDACATDDLGRFVFHVPPDTVVDLEFQGEPVERDRPALHLEGLVEAVRAPADDVTIRTRTPERDRRLVVRVLGVDGQPLPDAVVNASGPCFRDRGGARTGPDGRAHLEGLPPGPVTLFADRGPDTIAGSTWAPPAPLAVEPSATEVELRFRPGVLVEGVALDPEQKPRPGCDVRLFAGGALVGSARTDADGRFRATALPGVEHLLTANLSNASAPLSAAIDGLVPGREPEIVVHLAPFSWDGRWEKVVLGRRR